MPDGIDAPGPHMQHSAEHDMEPDHGLSTEKQPPVTIGAEAGLTLAAVEAVARHAAPVALAPAALARVRASRAFVERICAEDRTVYGVTTGFGHLSSVKIPPDELAALQPNLGRSHARGVGDPFDVPTTPT